jgi:uncharacterized protein
MRFVPRLLGSELSRAARHFPAVILTGPRRAGKTTLLRALFPHASYSLLEDPDIIARVRSDPRGFLEEARLPAILDEVQHVPELLNYLRARIDLGPRRMGQWLLTGSQETALMRGVSESMAGRAAVFHLLPFSCQESPRVSVLRGGFPEALAGPGVAQTWFRSYAQTYLERDVRTVSAIRDLATFRRFLALLCSRCGQILNKTDLAGALGVSVPTITEWIGILEVTGQIILVPPFYENFGKRLIKSPKLYFVDSGLACYLLGIETERALRRSPFLGPLFEGFVAAEIFKLQLNAGKARNLYYFRDQQGLEVDFVLPQGDRRLVLLEVKASRTVFPGMADPLVRLARAVGTREVSGFLIHQSSETGMATSVCRPGVTALSVDLLGSIFVMRGRKAAARGR